MVIRAQDTPKSRTTQQTRARTSSERETELALLLLAVAAAAAEPMRHPVPATVTPAVTMSAVRCAGGSSARGRLGELAQKLS